MNVHLQRFSGYFLYTIFMGFVLYYGVEYERYLKHITATTYSPYLKFIFKVFFPVVVGILLSVPQFIHVFRKDGSWKFDWIKLVSIGLPAFYLTVFPIVYFSPIQQYLPKLGVFVLTHSMFPQTVSGIVFGYLILSLFEKN